MTILPLHPAYVLYVVEHMRREDREEIHATSWTEDPRRLATPLCQAGVLGAAIAARPGEQAQAIVAAVNLWPGVWNAGMFATDRWPEVAVETSIWLKRKFIPELRAARAHRVECHVLERYALARRWLEWLGATAEAVVPAFGRERETFIRYAWLSDDVPARIIRAQHQDTGPAGAG